MTKVFDLLQLAKRNGVHISLHDGELQLKVSKGHRIDPQLLQQIKDHKSLITAFLQNSLWKSKKVEAFENQLLPFDRSSVPYIPLSFSQERLWFIDQLEGSVQYHMPVVLRLSGNLDRDALAHALQNIVQRHEVLRSVIKEYEGKGYQDVMQADSWALAHYDKACLNNDPIALKSEIQKLVSKPFDLSRDHMLRADLLRLSGEEHILAVVIHHIASDGWSLSIIVKEVIELYHAFIEKRPSTLGELPLQYADYAYWQRTWFQGEMLDKKISYWKNKLNGIEPLALPTDFERSAIQTMQGAVVAFTIDKELTDALADLGRQHQASMFMLLMAAFQVLMHRYSGQDDICIGTPVANRSYQEVEGLIGFFINTLAIRGDFSKNITFTELLHQIRDTTFEAYEHQDVPFEKVVDEVVTQRNLSRTPLFQVMFVLQNTPDVPQLTLGGLQLSRETFDNNTVKFEITLSLKETGSGTIGSIEYNADLFGKATIERMIGNFQQLLVSIVASPQQKTALLPLLTKQEERQLLHEFNNTTVDYPGDKTIVDLFEEQVRKTPENIALVFEDEQLSYAQLNKKANQLAHYLISKGVTKQTPVPICIERGVDMITGLLGILKAGGAYVPIDPQYPPDRIKYMLDDSGAALVVSSKRSMATLPFTKEFTSIEIDDNTGQIHTYPAENPASGASPDSLAYIMYTSGSTGEPKGVMATQHNVVSLVKGVDYVGFSDRDTLLSTGSPSFDATTFEYWGMLLNGGKLVLCSEYQLLDNELLKKQIRTQQVNKIWFTSSWFNQLVDGDISVFEGLETVVVGGEKLSGKHIEQLRQVHPFIALVNGYGPTENTTFSLTYAIRENKTGRSIPIGRPLANRSVYVLDGQRKMVPIGVTGEIYLGGAGLTRGYLNNGALTEEKFVIDPYGRGDGARMYKTGDMGCWLPDGNIQFQGRVDEQVKIRGYRIEPGEIEMVVCQQGSVKQCVVVAAEDHSGKKRLVGYVVAEGSFDREKVIAYLKTRLPEYMVPALWVQLETLPLTPNGKTDRKALPDVDMNEQVSHHYAAPRNEFEQKLAGIWQQLLRVEKVGIHDNFFEIGGHSLLAMQMMAYIRQQLQVEVSIRNLFIYPSISALSAHLQVQGQGVLLPAIEKQPRPAYIPLSFSQERLWFIDQLEGSLQYHIPTVLRLKGPVHQKALEYALQAVINRYEVLRTIILEKDGRPYQHVMSGDDWQLNIVSEFVYKDAQSLQQYIEKLIARPFDLSKDYMLHAHLIVLNDEEHVLVVVMHHIASDAWSMPVITEDVTVIYNAYVQGRSAEMDALPLQYADYAMWQRSYLTPQVLDEKVNYWKEKLQGVEPLKLPADYARPVVPTSEGASLSFRIDKGVSEELYALSVQYGTTIFMTLLAAFKVLLYRYSGQTDIVVGTSIANRDQQEVERMVGFFVNTLAFRDQVSGDTSFAALLHQVKLTTLEAYEHKDVPFEKVVEAVVKDRDTGINPVFQVMLVLGNTPQQLSQTSLNELVLSAAHYDHTISKFDLTFFITESPDGLHGLVQYRNDVYRADTMERMICHFKQLLRSVLQNPACTAGLLPMLTNEEQQKLIGFNDAQVAYPEEGTIVSLLEAQVLQNSGATAVVFAGEQLSYEQLNAKANQLAHYLIQSGVKNDTLVPLFIERSIDMITGIVGILKAGAAYVPIDTGFPADRIRYMLQDSGSPVVVSSVESRSKLERAEAGMRIIETDGPAIKDQPTHNTQTNLQPHHLAYVIYTSGSTGKPKGVMITHRNLVDYVFGLNQKIQTDACKTFALVSSTATDLGNTVIYSSLVLGGALHLFSKEAVGNTAYLHNYFRENRIDCLKIVPSHWKALSYDEQLLLPVKLLVFGGEALPSETVQQIRHSGSLCTVVNHYGPTETTIGKLLHITEPGRTYSHTIPIGKPFSNTEIYILSKELQLAPVGVPGQLYISGDGMARGYLNNHELTKEKFIQNPFSKEGNSLMYGTGDLVKYLPDGNIEFIGRADDQVKIRGYRIELGEIEAVLQQTELVNGAVVLAKDDQQGNKRLVAYVVPKGYFDREIIMEYIRARLPEYMVPSILVEMEKLPLTANGKTDRKALPDPDTSVQLSNVYVAPRTSPEKQLAAIWEEVLETEQVSIEDNFFELGGHSLLAVRLISAIRKSFDIELPIGAIFDYPTIATLITRFNQPGNTETLPAITVVHPRPEHLPLSFSQERLWFIDRMDGSVHYHVPYILRLKGNLNINALSWSLQQIINRHEVLRTVISEHAGQPFQRIKEKDKWRLTVADGSDYRKDMEGLQHYIKQLIDVPFDLSADDMLRASLISIDKEDYVLVVTLHHIVSDAYSTSIIVSELAALYNACIHGKEAGLPELPVQYADYALWQRTYLQGENLELKLGYWKEKLKGVPVLQFPADYARPLVQSTRGAVTHFRINKELSDQLIVTGHQQGTTLFMVLLAAFKVLLYRYSGQQDICVGTPVAGRQQQETEGLIGFFINSIALRTEINGNATFAELLQQVRATTLAAYSHQELPFEKVVEAVVTERDMSRSPVFQVMLTLQNTPGAGDLALDGLQLSNEGNSVVTHTTSKFDFTFFVSETAQGLQVSVEYCTDLYKEATIHQMAAHFTNLLQAAMDQPAQSIGRLPMLGESEVARLQAGSENTQTVFADNRTVIAMFQEQALNRPDAVAAVFGDEQISYSQLNQKANQLSRYLMAKGITAETLVPVCMKRSIELLVCMVGILKTGGAYVPIDPEYPQERIRFMLQDTAASLLLTSREVAAHLPVFAGVEVIDVQETDTFIMQHEFQDVQLMAEPHHLAYVIYTSGSTGKPKGVMIEHKSLTNLVNWHNQAYEVTPESRATAMAGIGFDAFGWEVWPYLACGATLYIIKDDVRLNQARLAAAFTDNKITHGFVATALAEGFVKGTKNRTTSLQYLLTGGDKLPSIDVENLSYTLVNNYGPTENTVVATNYILTGIDGKRIPPIGKAIANTAIYLLDEYNQMVPSGVWGEICIGGVQVARGYLNQPELTADRFINDPFDAAPHTRLYRTGDLARRVADGNLEYGGRKDSQVKIRGYRIELGEIENELQSCNLVKDAVVAALADHTGNLLLAGYIVPENSFNKDGIIAYLKNKLPAYMIPSVWIELDKLPLTPNGKVDKQGLPDVDGSFLTGTKYVAPRTGTEEKLAAIWQNLLQKQQVGMYDNFFEMGGHSLMAMRMITHIEESLFISVPIKALFQFTCINDLGKYLDMQATGMPDKQASAYRFIDV